MPETFTRALNAWEKLKPQITALAVIMGNFKMSHESINTFFKSF